jgi:hypothetical protein
LIWSRKEREKEKREKKIRKERERERTRGERDDVEDTVGERTNFLNKQNKGTLQPTVLSNALGSTVAFPGNRKF